MAIIIVLWSLIIGVYSFKGYTQIQSGIALANSGHVQFVKNKNGSIASSDFSNAASDFNSAKNTFNNPIVAPMKAVPFIGTQLYSVVALSASASILSTVSSQTLSYYALIHHASSLGEQLSLIKGLRSVASKEKVELKSINLGPKNGLISPLSTQRAALANYAVRANTLISQIGS